MVSFNKRQIQIENFNRNKQIKQSKTIPMHKPKEELLIFLETYKWTVNDT